MLASFPLILLCPNYATLAYMVHPIQSALESCFIQYKSGLIAIWIASAAH